MFARPLTRAVDVDVPVRHGYLLVSLLTFLVAFLIKPASIFCDFLAQMANEFSMMMAPSRQAGGVHHHLLPIDVFVLRLPFVVVGISFKPGLLWVM